MHHVFLIVAVTTFFENVFQTTIDDSELNRHYIKIISVIGTQLHSHRKWNDFLSFILVVFSCSPCLRWLQVWSQQFSILELRHLQAFKLLLYAPSNGLFYSVEHISCGKNLVRTGQRGFTKVVQSIFIWRIHSWNPDSPVNTATNSAHKYVLCLQTLCIYRK